MTNLKELFEKAKADDEFWFANHQKVPQSLPRQVCGEEVVAVDEDLLRLGELLEAKGLKPGQVRVSFINTRQGFFDPCASTGPAAPSA